MTDKETLVEIVLELDEREEEMIQTMMQGLFDAHAEYVSEQLLRMYKK